MATIASHLLPPAMPVASLWAAFAAAADAWLDARFPGQPAVRADAVVLLPSADLLAPARRAFAARSGWMPRLHTARTLATALGPPTPRAAGELTGDAAIDRIAAHDLLRRHAWARRWLQRDPAGFDAAVQRMVHTAHALRRHADAMPPAARDEWFAQARQRAGGGGPGSLQRLLLRVAIEWAAIAAAPATDRLFAHRPSAWIALTLGGDDALTGHVLAHAAALGVPAQAWTADPPGDDPFDGWPECADLTLQSTVDGESEALAAAAQVAEWVQAGTVPIALVAQDRALVRRVRALLERRQIAVLDETGWSLATTRAGAHAGAALRAATDLRSLDDVLDWLKADLDESQGGALAWLEKLWRGQRVGPAARQRAEALWQRERARLEAFALPGRRALGDWLLAFDALLYAAPHATGWRDDAAAKQLRRALRLGDGGGIAADDAAWQAALASPCSLDEFAQWVAGTLEASSYLPAEPPAAAVVVTPLSRAIGREFAAAVLAGADETRLGPLPHDPGLLDEAVRRALGLPVRGERQRRALLGFVQLLRVPRVALLHRDADGDERLSVSAWVERLAQARRRRGAPALAHHAATLSPRALAAAPVAMPRPAPGRALPASWSASAVEALRQCPYRFFARTVLVLSEADELDDDADKRDAGRWLHAALERFHLQRAGHGGAPEADVAALLAAGHDALAAMVDAHEVSAEAMLPFTADWPALAGRYVHWLHERERDGWRFAAAELALELPPDGSPGLRLHGRIDRIDRRSADGAACLIDYKLQSAAALRTKVRAPLEDTQLAVYAALHDARDGGLHPVQAAYLALDDDVVTEVPHPQVRDSAQRLLHELALERARIEAGAPLPALGEPPACDHCDARGLCRRDHWAGPDGLRQRGAPNGR